MQTHYSGKVKTLLLGLIVAHLFKTLYAKFYQKRPSFVQDATKYSSLLLFWDTMCGVSCRCSSDIQYLHAGDVHSQRH